MQGEVVGQALVPEGEAPVEDAFDAPHEERDVDVEGRAPVDLVLEEASALGMGREAMRVYPAVEGAAHLLVPEENPFLERRVAHGPWQLQRARPGAHGDRSSAGNVSVARRHAHVFPRRKKAFQGAGARVPGEDLPGRVR